MSHDENNLKKLPWRPREDGYSVDTCVSWVSHHECTFLCLAAETKESTNNIIRTEYILDGYRSFKLHTTKLH